MNTSFVMRFVMVWGLLAGAAAAEAADIRLRVVGLKEARGNVQAALFLTGDDFKSGDAYAQSEVLAKRGGVEVVFTGVAPGRYGLSVFHDINANEKLDTSFVGIPKEPYGFSNNVRGRFGPPLFDDFSFEVSEEDQSLEVRLE